MSIGLGIYLGSVAFSYISLSAVSRAILNKAKRKGYEEVKEKKSFSEKIVSFLKNILVCMIPVVNLFYGIGALAVRKDKLYDNFIEKAFKEGKLKKTEDTLKKEAEEIIKQEKMKKAKNSLGKGKMGVYNTMSDEDKLEILLDEDTLKESYDYGHMTEEEQQEFKNSEMEKVIESYHKNESKVKVKRYVPPVDPNPINKQ